jgi:hypothetical protein
MVYFIEAVGRDRVKIGFTGTKVTNRLKELQCASPDVLSLLGTIKGGRSEELHLHRRFAEHHISGEWFRLSPIRDELLVINGVVLPIPRLVTRKDSKKPSEFAQRRMQAAKVGPIAPLPTPSNSLPTFPSPLIDVAAWFFHVTEGAWDKSPFTV